ncbi:MAG: radical SAM protein [Candidatus Avigastranaerophilus sp.]
MAFRACDNLNTSICFNGYDIGITYCTLTNASNGKGWPKLSADVFNEGVIDWDKFFLQRAKLIEDMKNSNEQEECRNCHRIENLDFIDDRKIRYILLSPWQICNSDCIYCLGHEQPVSYDNPDYKKLVEPYDIVSILKDMIEKNVLAENAEFDFAGGEPTLYPSFDEIIDLLLDNNYKNIIIHTNNIQYSKAVEKGIKLNAISLMISIDAGTKKCHEKVKRVKSFDRVWKNFKTYSKSKPENYTMKLCTKYVIVPGINDSEKEIKEFIKQSKKHGATHVAINVYNQLLNNMEYDENLLRHLYNLGEFFKEYARKEKIYYISFPNIELVYAKFNKNFYHD